MGVAKVFRGSTIRISTIAIEYTIRMTQRAGPRLLCLSRYHCAILQFDGEPRMCPSRTGNQFTRHRLDNLGEDNGCARRWTIRSTRDEPREKHPLDRHCPKQAAINIGLDGRGEMRRAQFALRNDSLCYLQGLYLDLWLKLYACTRGSRFDDFPDAGLGDARENKRNPTAHERQSIAWAGGDLSQGQSSRSALPSAPWSRDWVFPNAAR
jgi:hypothetical protein